MSKTAFQIQQDKTELAIKEAEQAVMLLRVMADERRASVHQVRLKNAQGYLVEARSNVMFCDGYTNYKEEHV